MPVDFDLKSVAGVAKVTAHGLVTLEDFKQAAVVVWQLPEEPFRRVLWDLRDAQFNLPATEIRELAEFSKRIAQTAKIQSAFVVSASFEFGLVRMFEAYRETEGISTSVFRDMDQALEWLTDPALAS